jgi:DNA-binding transcriptional LysR family regulator
VLPLLPTFLTTYARVKVHLSLSDAIISLIDDNVDVAVRMGRLRVSQLKARKLCDLRRVIIAAPSYIKRHGTSPTAAELRELR